LQRHLRACVDAGPHLSVVVKCLTKKQVLALAKPLDSCSNNATFKNTSVCLYCGKAFETEKLIKHSWKHETGTPFVVKCTYKGCMQRFCVLENLRKHTARHMIKSDASELDQTLQENQPSVENGNNSEVAPDAANEQEEVVAFG
jgi:hypothetical protein